MKTIVFVLTFYTSTLFFTSCKKNDTGGDASLIIHTAHHNSDVKGATVYVKFDARELPPDITSNYDLKVTAGPDEDSLHIMDLRYGNYFLYAVGYDSTISQSVIGGVSVEISWKERDEEIEIHIPLSD